MATPFVGRQRHSSRGGTSSWQFTIAAATACTVSFVVVTYYYYFCVSQRQKEHHSRNNHKREGPENDNKTSVEPIRHLTIQCCGNSMQYYNDCPKVLEEMIKHGDSNVQTITQDSCLRGGANLSSLYMKGNGMKGKFKDNIGSPTVQNLLTSSTSTDLSSNNSKVVVILNDHTLHPARVHTRNQSIKILKEKYIPLLLANKNRNKHVIIIQTPAYRLRGMRDTNDLGTFDEFTTAVYQGIQEYCNVLNVESKKIVSSCHVAPVGEAYRRLKHTNANLWHKLYANDDFHPSPHGTYLQACILYCMILSQPPNRIYKNTAAYLWKHARYMQPLDQQPSLPLPTNQEAEELRKLACLICF